MKINSLLIIAAIALITVSCGKKKKPRIEEKDPISTSKNAKGDSTIYGLACDGGSDSVIVLLPNAGGDPIKYNTTEARRNNKIFGTPKIGDWVGIIVDHNDKHKANLVVDLDEIKGTWTYQVFPKLKDIDKMSKNTARSILANMDDSIKATYMIPREYGFTLGRQSQATSVGRIYGDSYNEESPVEYPKVKTYTEWHAYNGKIILVQGNIGNLKMAKKQKVVRDTFEIRYLKDDSLILAKDGEAISYHRTDAMSANAKAQAAATKQQKKAQEELKQ